MALRISRRSMDCGRPPGLGLGIRGWTSFHWASVRSVGYFARLIPFSTPKTRGEVHFSHRLLERRLGRFDPEVQKALAEGGDPEAARARIEEMVGPSGFMLFGTSDHGSLLRIVCRPRKAVQYVVGNPLFAVEMTRHSIGAALYAPLRVLIYEEDGKTCIEYDRPSSLFGQFGDGQVDAMASSLDQKLADLAAEAIR